MRKKDYLKMYRIPKKLFWRISNIRIKGGEILADYIPTKKQKDIWKRISSI